MCNRGGAVLGETVSSVAAVVPKWEIVAIGNGSFGSSKLRGVRFEDAGVGSSLVASLRKHILEGSGDTVVVAFEGVSFCSGSLEDMAVKIENHKMSVVTPPCTLQRNASIETIFGATTKVELPGDKKFLDILGLKPVFIRNGDSNEVLGVFPGCYGFKREWFETIGALSGILSLGSVPIAVSLFSWLLGGSCVVSDVPVKTAVWSDEGATWQDHLDKLRIAYSAFPSLAGNKIVMAMPECVAKTKAITEMQFAIKEILADKRRFEEHSDNLIRAFERFGVQI